MVTRSVKLFLEAIVSLCLGLALVASLVAWRLASGPISLDILSPYVEQALSAPDGSYRVRLEHTVLAWAAWSRSLDLSARGVRVLDATGRPLASLPQIYASFSSTALLSGILAPTSLDLVGARILLRRDAGGRFDLQLGEETGAPGRGTVALALLRDLTKPPEAGRALGYLRRIQIINCDLVIDDSRWNTFWKARARHIMFGRGAAGLRLEMELDFEGEGLTSHVAASGVYDTAAQAATLAVGVEGLRPALLAHAVPMLSPLARLALPVTGTVTTRVMLDGTIDQLSFDLQGGAGRLALPELYQEDVEIRQVSLRGALSERDNRLDLTTLSLDLGGPVLTLSGTITGLDGRSEIALDLTGRDIKTDELASRWPTSIAPNPRRWITANLSRGAVEELHASFRGHGQGLDPAGLLVDRLAGSMKLGGIDVHYLGKLPPVRGVDGDARFDDKSFTIAVRSGTVEGLAVEGGTIAITGLESADQRIAIALDVGGPLSDALGLIDREPLGYASALGIDPKTVAGTSATHLQLEFPLIHDLRFAQMQVQASATMTDARLTSVFYGQDLSGGDLALNLDRQGMNVTGRASLGPVPVSLAWQEAFGKTRDRRVRVTGELDDAARKALDWDIGELVSGALPFELELHSIDRASSEIALTFDLAKASLALPLVDWRKSPDVPGTAHAVLALAGERISAIRSFDVAAADLSAHGRAEFDPLTGRFSALNFDRLAFSRNQLAGEVVHRPDGSYDIRLRGDQLDVAPFISRKQPATETTKAEQKPKGGPRLAITLSADRLWLSDSAAVSLRDATGTIDHDGDRVARMVIDAKTASNAPVHLELLPTARGRNLTFSAADGGEVLRALDFFNDMVGGKLKITGKIDDTKPSSPLAGTLRIDGYKLLNAPFLAKMLTLISLTGIVDRLSGEGISFSTLVAPFTMTDDRVELLDGRAVGSDLGFTFKGLVDFAAGEVNMSGTIVPVYTLNSLLGNIPIVGSILVGPEGGGVFAATYQATGKLANPDISVNPLTALAPGILRGFLDLLSGGGGGAGGASPPAPPEQPRLGDPLK